jgi:hypothetical protein
MRKMTMDLLGWIVRPEHMMMEEDNVWGAMIPTCVPMDIVLMLPISAVRQSRVSHILDAILLGNT